jgi:hypothetical protein
VSVELQRCLKASCGMEASRSGDSCKISTPDNEIERTRMSLSRDERDWGCHWGGAETS